MHALIVSHLALPHVGGVENLVDLEIQALLQVGHRATLLTSDGSGAGRVPNYPSSVRVIRVPAKHVLERKLGIPYPLFGPRLVIALQRAIAEADVVHAHGFMFENSVIALLLARQQGKPSILTDHGGIQKFGSRPATWAARLGAETLGRLSALTADRLVSYNGRVLRTLNHLGRRRDGEFLPNPVDRSVFFPPSVAERAAARQSLGWDPQRKKVLFAGRLIAAKGVPLILAAADPAYDLVFCGPGDAALLGPLPRPGVEYFPPRPQAELRSLYHAADALVLPAEVREGFPLVVQEAIACGLPVVLGYDPGFEPYRVLPNLLLCQRTVDDVRARLLHAVGLPRTDGRATEFFPTLTDWVRQLYRLG